MLASHCLNNMVAPGQPRPNIWRQGIIQIMVTRSCDQACYGCTQGSNLRGFPNVMPAELYADALDSLEGYFGVIGMFGGNPASHPQFDLLCEILREKVPFEQRGLWCNNPLKESKARMMRETFNPAVSNLNVHMDQSAYDLFSREWPECRKYLKGLDSDSRHGPPFVAMKDLKALPRYLFTEKELLQIGHQSPLDPNDPEFFIISSDMDVPNTDANRNILISRCDINQNWSALIGTFRGELRAWFCEIAGAQSMLNQLNKDYPDTGLNPTEDYIVSGNTPIKWWELPMRSFKDQVSHHCHGCGIPLKGWGNLAVSDPSQAEQVSATYADIYKPKVKGRQVELVELSTQLGQSHLPKSTDYIENASL